MIVPGSGTTVPSTENLNAESIAESDSLHVAPMLPEARIMLPMDPGPVSVRFVVIPVSKSLSPNPCLQRFTTVGDSDHQPIRFAGIERNAARGQKVIGGLRRRESRHRETSDGRARLVTSGIGIKVDESRAVCLTRGIQKQLDLAELVLLAVRPKCRGGPASVVDEQAAR